MAKFDYQGAKKAGYSDEEINGFLSQKHPNFNFQEAKKAGYSAEEINNFLSQKEKSPTLKSAASSYASGLAGGAGGIVPDILESPFGGAAGQLISKGLKKLGVKGTSQIAEETQNELMGEQAQNAVERILQQAGEFGGLEAVTGTALGGPAAGGLGLAHGSVSGTVYGALKEIGIPDEWALGITAMASLSPIAARKLIDKFKQGKSLNESVKSVEKEIKKSSDIPPPPGGGGGGGGGGEGTSSFPFKGTEVPAGRQGFELAEEALEKLQQPRIEGPEGQIAFKSPTIEETKPLTGRAKIISNETERVVSPDKFENEAHGGLNLSGNIRKNFDKAMKDVRAKYKIAEKTYDNTSDIFPSLAQKVEEGLEKMILSANPSPGEKVVISTLQNLRNLIGQTNGLVETNLSKLVRTADSIASSLKYEIPEAGAKNFLKPFVEEINKAVIESLEKKGISARPIKLADKAYGEMASLYFSDEISPFLERNTRNPEALFRKSVSDEGTYRALRESLGESHPSVAKLERAIVADRIKPYVSEGGIEKIGKKQFENDMANLEGLIGKEKANKVRDHLEKRKKFSPKAPGKAKLEKHRITDATLDRASRAIASTPEEIETLMSSRSGIRKLRKELNEAGESTLFDKLSQEKTMDILRGGVVTPEKITGQTLWENMRQKKNYDILTELYGKDVVDAALVDVSKAHNKMITVDKLIRLGKLAGTTYGASKLVKIFSILF